MSSSHSNQRFSFSSLKRSYTNPHKLYDDLRATDPIYFDPLSECWIVTGYPETIAILEDERFTSNLGAYAPKAAMGSDIAEEALSKSMFFKDGPEHLRANHYLLKHVAQNAKRLTQEIQSVVEKRMSVLASQGHMDIIQDFAAPISFAVTFHLLGIDIPTHDDFWKILRYAETISDISSGYPVGNPQDVFDLMNYFAQQVEAKRTSPSNDLIGAFLNAPDIFDDQASIVSSAAMVLAAGYVTTKKLIGTGTARVLERWQEFQSEYQQNPGLPKLLCEELLRLSPPTRYIVRWASEDADLSTQFPGKHSIQHGQKILLFLEAANYDPRNFTQPGDFNLAGHTSKHLTFGHGKHRCPGASIARLEAHASLQTLLQIPHLAADANHAPVWNPNPNLGGFRSFPVIFDPHSRA